MAFVAPSHNSPARIEYLRVRNFRALRDVEFKTLTPMAVLSGPNGSGKSTVFDALAFLAECFELGLRRARDKRGRLDGIKTGRRLSRSSAAKARSPRTPLIVYHLEVDERDGALAVVRESLCWARSGRPGRAFRFLDYKEGRGEAASGEAPDAEDQRVEIPLQAPDLLAANALGQFADHPRVVARRNFIVGWHISYRAPYRRPDGIKGGTWEAFERVMRRRRYFRTGLNKVEAARAIAAHIEPARNRSPSFKLFHDAIVEAAVG